MAKIKGAGVNIATPEPKEETPIVSTATVYQNKKYKIPIASYIDGDSWTVDYFNVQFGNDDTVKNTLDVHDHALHSLMRIKNMELRVTDHLNPTFDSNTQETRISGRANVYPIVTPTVGDNFVADIGDGMISLLIVTDVERNSYFGESAYTISYEVVGMLSESEWNTILTRVVTTQVFDKRKMVTGEGALFTESEYQRLIERDKLISDSLQLFYNEFYDLDTRSFAVPLDGGYKLYDPFVTKFFCTTIEPSMILDKEMPKNYGVETYLFNRPYTTIFDAIVQCSKIILNNSVKEMTRVSSTAFGTHWVYYGLFTSRYKQVIYPKSVGGMTLPDSVLDTNPGTYIFSSNFYNNDYANMDPLERLISKYLDGQQTFEYTELKTIMENILRPETPPLFKFHRTLLVIMLLRLSR